MKKSILFFLFSLYTSALFADGVKIGDLNYNLDATSRTAEVTYQCTGLVNYSDLPDSSLIIPSYVKHENITYSVIAIGYQAFVNCRNLISVTIPNSVITIDANAFFSCSRLTKIAIPNSVSNIGPMAFYNCIQLKSAILPKTLRVIRGSTFEGCTSLVSVTFPDSLSTIYDGAFKNCTSLRSAILPDSVTYIGSQAFKDCRSLTKVSLPSGLTSLQSNTFTGDSALQEIYNYVDSPLVINGNFSGADTLTCILYVPETSIALYQEANGWKSFQNILPLPDGTQGGKDAVEYLRPDRLAEPRKILDNGRVCILMPGGSRYTVTGQRIQ